MFASQPSTVLTSPPPSVIPPPTVRLPHASPQVVPFLLKFIDSLTNVYVRFNRKRLKGRTDTHDCQLALSCLYHVRCFHLVSHDILLYAESALRMDHGSRAVGALQ